MLTGIDIGGTFTDGVYIDEKGRKTVAKSLSTPQDGFIGGFLNCIEDMSKQAKKNPVDLLKSVRRFTHGSTIATNTVIEDTGAKVGVITTKGHRDVLKDMLGRGRITGRPIDDVYFVLLPKPEQITPDNLIIEVTERSDHKGAVIVKLNEVEAEKAIRTLLDRGAETLAVCFLWSFLNPAHEHRVKEIALKIKPNLFVSCSCDVVPKLGEYQRFTAAVVNSAIQPKSSAYIDGVINRLKTKYSFDKPLYIMACDGGVQPWNDLRNNPIYMLDSGPVGGMCAAEKVCAQLKEDNLVCVDMGGTSFDMGIVFNGNSEMKDTGIVKQWEYAISRYDIESIGAGGGSIAWYDTSLGAIKIGPRSAGGNPGPACYGLGGTEPTVSDADLVLGYLNPDIEIAGKKLNKKKAMEAIGMLGEKIGRGAEEMAIGIFDLVNEGMAGKVRSELIARGLDHRQFSMLCYGGAGPLHMTEIANLIGMKRSIVPQDASVFSADGLCFADVKCRNSKEVVYAEPWDMSVINADFAGITQDVILRVKATGIDSRDIEIRKILTMQFKGQFYQLRVPVTSKEISKEDLAKAKEEFVNTYASRYGKAALMPGANVLIMSEAIECVGKTVRIELSQGIEATKIAKDAIKSPRKMYSKKERGFVEANVYYGEKLLSGNKIKGPALIDFEHTTIRLGHGETGIVDEHLNIIV